MGVLSDQCRHGPLGAAAFVQESLYHVSLAVHVCSSGACRLQAPPTSVVRFFVTKEGDVDSVAREEMRIHDDFVYLDQAGG
jgi:hypothetical protein